MWIELNFNHNLNNLIAFTFKGDSNYFNFNLFFKEF